MYAGYRQRPASVVISTSFQDFIEPLERLYDLKHDTCSGPSHPNGCRSSVKHLLPQAVATPLVTHREKSADTQLSAIANTRSPVPVSRASSGLSRTNSLPLHATAATGTTEFGLRPVTWYFRAARDRIFGPTPCQNPLFADNERHHIRGVSSLGGCFIICLFLPAPLSQSLPIPVSRGRFNLPCTWCFWQPDRRSDKEARAGAGSGSDTASLGPHAPGAYEMNKGVDAAPRAGRARPFPSLRERSPGTLPVKAANAKVASLQRASEMTCLLLS